jgi:hypothetical protein
MLDCGWEPGTIGEFDRLSQLAQANRSLMQDIADTSGAGLLARAVAAGTLLLHGLTSGMSPVDTGTLRSAHRGEVEPFAGGVQGTVFIDPDVRNPVSKSRPALYGEVWADRYFNWFERVADTHGETVLDGMEQTIMSRVGELWL